VISRPPQRNRGEVAVAIAITRPTLDRVLENSIPFNSQEPSAKQMGI
jgi:hypothetical protein